MKLSKITFIFSALFLFSLTSCNQNKVGDKTPESITLSGFEYIPVNLQLKFEAKILPLDASLDVTWSSENKKIAIVDEYGWVTGVSDGKTIIKATSKKSSKIFGEFEVNIYSSISQETFLNKYGEFYDNFLKDPDSPEKMGGICQEGDCYPVNGNPEYYPHIHPFYLYDKDAKTREFEVSNDNETSVVYDIFTKDGLKEELLSKKIEYKTLGYSEIKEFYYADDEYVSYFIYGGVPSKNVYSYEYSGFDQYCYLIRGVEVFSGYTNINVHITPTPIN